MGWFTRKKKKAAEAAILAAGAGGSGADVASGAGGAAGSDTASAAPASDELAAVLSAAALAHEADSFAAYAGSPARMELAAVISAAIAAYEGGGVALPYIGTGPSGLYVRRLNRNAGYAPAWGVMGNREAIDARRF
jgi:hypothetical protein